MTIGEIQGIRNLDVAENTRNGVGPGPEQAARNREIAEAIRTINEGGGVGPSSELRFAIDQGTGQALIRIVDRVTDEVITQLPPETALRAAEILRNLQPVERIA